MKSTVPYPTILDYFSDSKPTIFQSLPLLLKLAMSLFFASIFFLLFSAFLLFLSFLFCSLKFPYVLQILLLILSHYPFIFCQFHCTVFWSQIYLSMVSFNDLLLYLKDPLPCDPLLNRDCLWSSFLVMTLRLSIYIDRTNQQNFKSSTEPRLSV